jgi:hypothetical protein
MKKILVLIVCFQIIVMPSLYAAENGSHLSLSQEIHAGGSGSEFISGNYPGAILMPVNLWGSVGKPGIHHIPTHTDLVTLLSLAGGPGNDAQLDNITIKRRTGGEEKILKVDGEDLLSKANVHSPILEANDIIIIPRDKPIVGNNTMVTVTFIGSILALVLTAYAVANTIRR